MITMPRRHNHPSRGANRPSDIAVTVNINAEINLMDDYPVIEYFSMRLVPEECQSVESSAVYTAPPFCVESVPGHSNWSLPSPPLNI
jgi:hypothetical protein